METVIISESIDVRSYAPGYKNHTGNIGGLEWRDNYTEQKMQKIVANYHFSLINLQKAEKRCLSIYFNLQLKLFITTATITVILKDLTRDVQVPVSTIFKKELSEAWLWYIRTLHPLERSHNFKIGIANDEICVYPMKIINITNNLL